jgi:hypothetical protein
MRKFMVIPIITAAVLSSSCLTLTAGAATSLGASDFRSTAANRSLIQQIACWPGMRDGCPYHMKQGRYYPCVPCRHGPGY